MIETVPENETSLDTYGATQDSISGFKIWEICA